MAELGEVLDALQALVTSAVYSGNTSLVGFPVTIGVGWPDNSELDKALRQGRAFIAISPQEGERNTVDYMFVDQEVPRAVSNISIAFDPVALVATVTGTAGPLDAAGFVFNNVAYNIGVAAGDTASAIAAKIAALIPGAVQSGATVTIPTQIAGVLTFDDGTPLLTDLSLGIGVETEVIGAYSASFITGVNGLSFRTVGTAERRLQINIWTDNQTDRDKVAQPIIQAVSNQHFLAVPTYNGEVIETAKINYSGGTWSDKTQNAGGYMRSIIATVKWYVNTYTQAYDILFVGGANNGVSFGPILHS